LPKARNPWVLRVAYTGADLKRKVCASLPAEEFGGETPPPKGDARAFTQRFSF
jgi:hypothetical protein